MRKNIDFIKIHNNLFTILHHDITSFPQLSNEICLFYLDDSQERKYELGACSKINRHSGEARFRFGRYGYCSNDRTT